jgi:hypothetical protein
MSEDGHTQIVNQIRPRFDGTINLGHLLILGGFLASAAIAFSSVQSDITNHDWRLKNIESIVRDQSQTNNQLKDAMSEISRDIAVIRTKVDGRPQ